MPIGGIGSNAMCNSNVKVTFERGGGSGKEDAAEEVAMPIGLSVAFGAVRDVLSGVRDREGFEGFHAPCDVRESVSATGDDSASVDDATATTR